MTTSDRIKDSTYYSKLLLNQKTVDLEPTFEEIRLAYLRNYSKDKLTQSEIEIAESLSVDSHELAKNIRRQLDNKTSGLTKVAVELPTDLLLDE